MAVESESVDHFDLVIVGSGFSGLCAAKTYTQVNPQARVVVYEAESGLGGVWGLERIYPNLQTNNLYGHYEFSDFPASKADINLPSGSHIPGRDVNKYLSAYARYFDLDRRIRYRHRVEAAHHLGEDGWRLQVQSTASGQTTTSIVTTTKLIVASGLCSKPNMPRFDHLGSDDFKAPIFHGKEMATRPETFKSARSVVVIGGTKMGWDAAYSYALAGVKVHWVMRTSGHGPCWMAPAEVTPFKLQVEQLVMTRLLTWFSPCVWGGGKFLLENWVRNFLHRSPIGRRLVRALFGAIQEDVCSANRYDRSKETEKLRPWIDFFWIAGGQGVLGYRDDVFKMVEDGLIEVHIDEIQRLSEDTVHLTDKALPADAIVCCTGWNYEPSVQFHPKGIAQELGLPHWQPTDASALSEEADAQICDQLPLLKDQPRAPPHSTGDNAQRPNQPYRLYKFMAPAPPYFHERNLAFVGFQINFGVPLTVQTQSLWIAAYFAGEVAKPSQQHQSTSHEKDTEKLLDSQGDFDTQLRRETMLHTQYCKWRFPWGFGSRFPDFIFELMPYLDMLLMDLGLNPNRKYQESIASGGTGWANRLTFGWATKLKGCLRETLEPYGKRDYVGLTEEWLSKKTA